MCCSSHALKRRAVLNQSASTALRHERPNSFTRHSSPTCLITPRISPKEGAGNNSRCYHHRYAAPAESQRTKSQAQRSMRSMAVPFHSLSSPQCVINLSAILLANSAKQNFPFNISRARELLRENPSFVPVSWPVHLYAAIKHL